MRWPTVTVAIPQWGKTDFTNRAVDAFRRSDYAGEIEILVWDNGSPEGPGTVAERDDVLLHLEESNVGFGPAMNGMAWQASGELLLLANNDIIPVRDCLTWLVRRHLEHGSAGAVSPRYRSFGGTQLESGSYLGRDGRGWQLYNGVEAPESVRRTPYLAHYGSAACLLVDRKHFIDSGGFDDRYAPAYYEDTDFCVGSWVKGMPTVVEPRAVVFHYEGGTAGKDVKVGPKAQQLKNRAAFHAKWRDWLRGLPELSFRTAFAHSLRLGSAKAPVLWVTPHLPRADREAGHARIMRMLGLLKEAGHPVALWAENCHDPDRYGRELEAMGIPWFGFVRRERWAPPHGNERVLEGLGDVLDAVDWGTVVISFPEFAERIMSDVRAHVPKAAVLIDDVDLHFLRNDRAVALHVDQGGGLTKERELAAYRRSDGVITASTYETEVLEQEIPGVALQTYAVAAEVPREDEPPEPGVDLLFLGNFQHPPNVDAVDWWIDEVGPRVQALAGRRIPLRVIGSGSSMYEDTWAERGDLVEVVGWVADLAEEFRKARVFLAPLRFGAGTKGKVALAISQGVPTVTTTVGAEGVDRYVAEALWVADDPDELAQRIVELMTDDAVWKATMTTTMRAAQGSFERQQALSGEFTDWVERRRRAKGLRR